MSNPSSPAPLAASGAAAAVLSISELNRIARAALEDALPPLWVGGEVSNLVRAASGHLYFTLKDADAQVRCTMWRNRAQSLATRPENGMRVEVRAQATLYEARGDYQLNVDALRPAGIGALFEAFRRLKDKLAAEGLFDAAQRRPLPRYPRAIGVVTSTSAAALRDVLAALQRRAPHLPVVIYPSQVQGADAAAQLAAAVHRAGARAAIDGVDVLLLVRGGGSIEDLWAFNDEALARAIRACGLPVLSGVGHETDFTIADFAADLRAPTPTGAAELASAGWYEAQATLAPLQLRLRRTLQRQLDGCAQRLDRAALRLVHPRQRLQRGGEQLSVLAARLRAAASRQREQAHWRTGTLELRLRAARPALDRLQAALAATRERLERATTGALAQQQRRLDALQAQLTLLAPQAVLARGYAIARDSHGRVLRSSSQVACGDAVTIQLSEGRLHTRVSAASETGTDSAAT